LCWANESWEGRWYGVTDNKGGTLIKQEYPEGDYEKHFFHLLKSFKDKRYITVEGKPLFQVFCPHLIPDAKNFAKIFNDLAQKNGLPGIYLVGGQKTPLDWNPIENGFDAIMSTSFTYAVNKGKKKEDKVVDFIWHNKLAHKLFTRGKSLSKISLYEYKKLIKIMKEVHSSDATKQFPVFPIVIHDFDNTARAGKKGMIFQNSTPALFQEHLKDAIETIQDKEKDKKIIFVKSWNEWAEGNYLEPDTKYGTQYLEAISQLVNQ
jgi:hypothetical protein